MTWVRSKITDLENISRKLRFAGFVCSNLTILNLIFVLAILIFRHYWQLPDPFVMIPITGCVAIVMIPCLFYFDIMRRSGSAIFDELSNELQWHSRSKETEDEPLESDLKNALRIFSQVEDLPLIPGRLGPAAFVVLNILIALLVAGSYRGGLI